MFRFFQLSHTFLLMSIYVLLQNSSYQNKIFVRGGKIVSSDDGNEEVEAFQARRSKFLYRSSPEHL